MTDIGTIPKVAKGIRTFDPVKNGFGTEAPILNRHPSPESDPHPRVVLMPNPALKRPKKKRKRIRRKGVFGVEASNQPVLFHRLLFIEKETSL